ncbi:MAG: glycosyltransferase family 2 protein [Betaproteobacteria bacterium]
MPDSQALKTGSPIRLSICIATYNRGRFIAQTLDSILGQMESGVELIVVDGASPDNTPEVLAHYCSRHPELTYRREPVNSGVDADYDKAVGYATGEYCWLMTDDDLLKPGAVRRVLETLEGQAELVVVNAEVRNADLSKKMEDRRLAIFNDISYTNAGEDQFLRNTGAYLSFIGGVVIKKDAWMSRDRTAYYGSLFIHVGIIFQKPVINNVMVIAEPLIEIRYGNAMWTARGFEIWMFKWPQLIWSFPGYSDEAKRAVCREQPWRSAKALFHHRAMGSYSLNEFRRFWPDANRELKNPSAWLISLFPASVANFVMVFYFALKATGSGMALYDLLHSRHTTWASLKLAEVLGVEMLD